MFSGQSETEEKFVTCKLEGRWLFLSYSPVNLSVRDQWPAEMCPYSFQFSSHLGKITAHQKVLYGFSGHFMLCIILGTILTVTGIMCLVSRVILSGN